MKTCPRCGGKAQLSHGRGFIERQLLKRLKIRPFRCRDCSKRFYRSVWSEKPTKKGAPGILQPIPSCKAGDRPDFSSMISKLKEAEKKVEAHPNAEMASPNDDA